MAAAALADIDQSRGGERQNPRIDQRIVQDHVGLADRTQRPQCQQLRIAGPGAGKNDRMDRDVRARGLVHGAEIP